MTFNGNGANESFSLSANGPRARFLRNVANITMDLDDVERVAVNSLGGSDTLTVDDLRAIDVRAVDHDEASALGGTTPDAANDQTILNAGNGSETITATGAGGSASVAGVAAAVTIAHAEGSRDTLTINALGGDDRVTAAALAADTLSVTADGGAGSATRWRERVAPTSCSAATGTTRSTATTSWKVRPAGTR
jgi:hypothetical protein